MFTIIGNEFVDVDAKVAEKYLLTTKVNRVMIDKTLIDNFILNGTNVMPFSGLEVISE
jgi:hypothetical protein